MNGTHDTNETGTLDEGGELDPREAAELVEQTTIRLGASSSPHRRWW